MADLSMTSTWEYEREEFKLRRAALRRQACGMKREMYLRAVAKTTMPSPRRGRAATVASPLNTSEYMHGAARSAVRTMLAHGSSSMSSADMPSATGGARAAKATWRRPKYIGCSSPKSSALPGLRWPDQLEELANVETCDELGSQGEKEDVDSSRSASECDDAAASPFTSESEDSLASPKSLAESFFSLSERLAATEPAGSVADFVEDSPLMTPFYLDDFSVIPDTPEFGYFHEPYVPFDMHGPCWDMLAECGYCEPLCAVQEDAPMETVPAEMSISQGPGSLLTMLAMPAMPVMGFPMTIAMAYANQLPPAPLDGYSNCMPAQPLPLDTRVPPPPHPQLPVVDAESSAATPAAVSGEAANEAAGKAEGGRKKGRRSEAGKKRQLERWQQRRIARKAMLSVGDKDGEDVQVIYLYGDDVEEANDFERPEESVASQMAMCSQEASATAVWTSDTLPLVGEDVAISLEPTVERTCSQSTSCSGSTGFSMSRWADIEEDGWRAQKVGLRRNRTAAQQNEQSAGSGFTDRALTAASFSHGADLVPGFTRADQGGQPRETRPEKPLSEVGRQQGAGSRSWRRPVAERQVAQAAHVNSLLDQRGRRPQGRA